VIFAIVLIVPGGAIALLNFTLSYLVVPWRRHVSGRTETRVASGLPLIGSLLLIAALFVAPAGPMRWIATALLLVDTGGPHWFLGSVIWHQIAERRKPT
jgi:hypothetical protein